jgi:hypothetical protein
MSDIETPMTDTHAGGGDDDRNHSDDPFFEGHPYRALGVALGINFFIMWALTYAGVYRFDHIHLNLNRFYMALLMVAPMLVVMLVVMNHMFGRRNWNVGLIVGAVVLFSVTFLALQQQWLVGDKQFLRSMIPHHSIAIKTCERVDLEDPEIVQLCDEIIESQQREIAQMEDILDRLD